MWGVYLKPFSLTRRASKHFSLRWKASSRSSCHISSFLAKLTSTISRWGVYVKDFFLSPYQSLSLLHSSSSPHPRLSVSLILCQYVSPSFSPSPSCTLQFSFCLPQDVSKPISLLSVSPSPFFQSLSPTLSQSRLCVHMWLFLNGFVYIWSLHLSSRGIQSAATPPKKNL